MSVTPAGVLPDALPRAVVFDMDGLMLDSERWERTAWQAAARRQGHTVTEDFYATLVGRREVETRGLLREHFGPGFSLEEFRADVDAQLTDTLARGGLPVKAGLIELLDALDRRRILKAVASSTIKVSASQRLGPLLRRFDATAFGDEVSRGKPDPQIYRLAARRLGLAPRLCLALEDSPVGLTAARAAGLVVIVIPDLLPAPAEAPFVCKSLKDIADWVECRHVRDKP